MLSVSSEKDQRRKECVTQNVDIPDTHKYYLKRFTL